MYSLRSDRFISVNLFYPLIDILSVKEAFRVPILMYHSISDNRQFDGHPYYETNTTPQVFADHMRYLYQSGYEPVTLAGLIDDFRNGFPQKRKRIVITFDDGFQNFYTRAFPILSKYEFKASMYLPTRFINNKRRKLSTRNCMSWQEVRELQAYGIEFGSHSVTHGKLCDMSEGDIFYELNESKRRIEKETNQPVYTFAYPYAFPEQSRKFKELIKKSLVSCGYTAGLTTSIGMASEHSDKYLLKRIPVNSFDDILFFRAKLKGAYNWLSLFQKLKKLLLKQN